MFLNPDVLLSIPGIFHGECLSPLQVYQVLAFIQIVTLPIFSYVYLYEQFSFLEL
jgi:hypothetical protein